MVGTKGNQIKFTVGKPRKETTIEDMPRFLRECPTIKGWVRIPEKSTYEYKLQNFVKKDEKF